MGRRLSVSDYIIAGTYNLINNAAMMVERGLGCAVCFHLGLEYDNLRFVPLSPAVETGAVIVWKKNQIASQAVYKFIDFLKKYKMSISENLE